MRLAWAMSMHKAQGQTFRNCGVYLPSPVFTHGQLYVGASRSSSASGLRFWLGKNDGHGYEASVPYTHNIVYRSVLQMATGLQLTSTAPCSSLKRKEDTASPLRSSQRPKRGKTATSQTEKKELVQDEVPRAAPRTFLRLRTKTPPFLEQEEELLEERPEKYSDQEEIAVEERPEKHSDEEELFAERPEIYSDEEDIDVDKRPEKY